LKKTFFQTQEATKRLSDLQKSTHELKMDRQEQGLEQGSSARAGLATFVAIERWRSNADIVFHWCPFVSAPLFLNDI